MISCSRYCSVRFSRILFLAHSPVVFVFRNSKKGISKDDAMKAYIDKVAKGDPNWETSDIAKSFGQ